MQDVIIGQNGTTKWRRENQLRFFFIQYTHLVTRPTSGGLYIHDSEHPYICIDSSVEDELARDGGWISGRRRDRRADYHDKSQVDGRCILSTVIVVQKWT